MDARTLGGLHTCTPWRADPAWPLKPRERITSPNEPLYLNGRSVPEHGCYETSPMPYDLVGEVLRQAVQHDRGPKPESPLLACGIEAKYLSKFVEPSLN